MNPDPLTSTPGRTDHSAPLAVIEILNDLLEAEMNSVFRFMGEGYPYLNRATAEMRRPLREMVATVQTRTMQLGEMINRLGGVPTPRSLSTEEQYLAFLSFNFLLPKLVEAKRLLIQRYEGAYRALKQADPEVVELLRSHLAEHRAQLEALEHGAAHTR